MKSIQFFRVAKAIVVSSLILSSGAVIAGQDAGVIAKCEYLPLVSNILKHNKNASVCVDIPVKLTKAKVLFNMDKDAVDAKGNPVGLRHMFMLATGLKARMDKGLIKAEDISIVGLFHGSAASWALSNDWWKKHKKTNGNPYGKWIEKIVAMKNKGVNIQLEECGVTMSGKGWSNKDLYTSKNAPQGAIHVNQGAVARAIDLQQQGYAMMHPSK